MDLEDFRWLLTDAGQRLLARATEVYADPAADPVRAASAVRDLADDPGHAAAALTQARLRVRGVAKFGELARRMYFTPEALEQATRLRVAEHRAARLAAADVFVFPSLFEGSAVVTYEALACGLPCIVTPEAGSVVRDGREGVLVPSADIASLAQAMERVGSDPSLRASMAAAARQRAESYDWSRYHEAIVTAVRGSLRAAVA